MMKVQITYNPYTVKTEILINGKEIENRFSPLMYVNNKRLQEWIEPKGSWAGIFKALRTSTGESDIEIDFVGTFGDFDDLAYAKDKYGECFANIKLIHKNKSSAKSADPYEKMKRLKALYQELQDGPIEEFKSDDIKRNFEAAVNSDFRIVIVAPMSSGKSTLINALLGRDLLPAVNQATTAVITEIRDNDDMPDFVVNARDKHGKSVIENGKATKDVISELNYKKDPDDPEGKEALIHLIQLEGPVPNIPSNVLNTIFVDTPGGNYSQNPEHEEMMDEAIGDENKSLILYVLNGAQLGTDDSNVILQKIANAMPNSTNGKQSRDRFLFVANRMDEFDVSKEPYEEVIQKTILPQLEKNGIIEPNLFLASAQTAKLIRMSRNGEELSEKEEEDIETFIKRFNRPTRVLSKYASLDELSKTELVETAEKYAETAKTTESVKEAEKNRILAAELNSGIPAIEVAIKTYLEKYALAIKIKTAHDAFMKKLNERNMIANCEAEWAKSEESFKKVKKELKEKQDKCDHSEKLQEFRDKVDSITLDIKGVKSEQARITKKINRLIEVAKDKVLKDEADYILSIFRSNIQDIGEEAQVALDNALNNGVHKSCQNLVDEYSEYVKELDSEGFFTVGSFDVKKTNKFDFFTIGRPEDLLGDDGYIESERVKIGTKTVKKSGVGGFLARVFTFGHFGYETVNEYEDREYVKLKSLIQDQVTEIQHSFDKEMKDAISDTEKKVDKLKAMTKDKLEGLDQLVLELVSEIDKILISHDELQKKVKKNADDTKWMKGFISKVEDLLAV